MAALKSFEDLASFALHLGAVDLAVRHQMRTGLEKALVIIETDAKEQIGHYQGPVPGFPAWAALAESTEAKKARSGAPAGAPLLEHGGLYASIGHTVESDEAGIVGATDPTMVFHEFGTSKMPPRPVFGPAVVKNQEAIQKVLGHALAQGIVGGQVAAAGGYFGGDIKP